MNRMRVRLTNKISNKGFIFFALIFLVLSQGVVIAEYDTAKFNTELERFKQDGVLTQELIDNLDTLSPEQRLEILSQINPDSENFWNQWKTQFGGSKKQALLRGLSEDDRESFMKKYGAYSGIDLTGFGSENISFGDGNIIGNERGYFQMDKIEEYNKNNPNNKIISVSYKKNIGNSLSRTEKSSSLIFTKQDRSALDLTVSDRARGYYFNPITGDIGRVGENGLVDYNDPMSGNWNGNGIMKIEATNDKFVEIALDFKRDSNNKADDETNFAIFKDSKGEGYSPYQHPTEEKDASGNPIRRLKPASVVFDSEGKLSKLNNIYKDKGEKGWGGYFGEDTFVAYSKEEYDKKTKEQGQTAIFIDLENGKVYADAKRVEAGYGVNAREGLKKAGDVIERYKSDAEQIQKEVEDGYQKLKEVREARETIERLQKDYDKLSFWEKKNLFNPVVRDYNNARIIILENRNTIARNIIAKKYNLDPNSNLVKFLASEQGLLVSNHFLSMASSVTGAGEDIKNWLGKRIDLIDSPIKSNLNPVQVSRLDIQLSNSAARNLKLVEMQSGTLYIDDNSGNSVPIVERATKYNYILPSRLNEQNRYFDGIDFELYNPNYPGGGQRIRIASQNGELGAVGVRDTRNMRSVNGKYQIDAGGGVSYHWDFLFWEGGETKKSYETVLSADYQVDTDAYQRAKEFEQQSNAEYRRLYNQRGDPDGDGVYFWTKKDIDELTEIYNNNYVKYNQILNSGDIEMSISSSRLSEYLGSFSIDKKTENPILKKINDKTFDEDKTLQRIIAERGIKFSEESIESEVKNGIGNVLRFVQLNPSNSFQLTKDSKNNLYQIKAGNQVYNIDPIAAPFIGNILPVLAGSGYKDANGNLAIDMEHSRFGNHIGIYVSGGHYEGIKQSKRLERSSGYVRGTIESTARQIVEEAMKNPAYQSGYQVYNPYSCNRCR